MSDLNKATVLEAFDTLFNKPDYARAEQFCATHYGLAAVPGGMHPTWGRSVTTSISRAA